MIITPPKLKKGDVVRVIAPALSLAIINAETRAIAEKRFVDLGLILTFGKHVEEVDDFLSSSIESRIKDLHEAFTDKDVKAVLTVIGGHNSNQLLEYIDYDLIQKNPKILCGYSDITALANGIYAKTGLVTYSGPHYSTLGKLLDSEYTLNYFRKCLFSNKPFNVTVSKRWDDRTWWKDQNDRVFFDNAGWLVVNEGEAEGTIIGGNLCTLSLLQGTKYFPDLRDSILFIEDDAEGRIVNFDRDLQSLMHQPGFKQVKGIVMGRFQKASEATDNLIKQMITSKRALQNIPVIANVDFGHTNPQITFPIGGTARLLAGKSVSTLTIIKH